MLNKSFGVIYFHFNIFSEKTANKWVLKFAFFEMVESVPDLSISHYYHKAHILIQEKSSR